MELVWSFLKEIQTTNTIFRLFKGVVHFQNENILIIYSLPEFCHFGLVQGSSNLSLEGQSAAEFSSNPDQTHLIVIF